MVALILDKAQDSWARRFRPPQFNNNSIEAFHCNVYKPSGAYKKLHTSTCISRLYHKTLRWSSTLYPLLPQFCFSVNVCEHTVLGIMHSLLNSPVCVNASILFPRQFSIPILPGSPLDPPNKIVRVLFMFFGTYTNHLTSAQYAILLCKRPRSAFTYMYKKYALT